MLQYNVFQNKSSIFCAFHCGLTAQAIRLASRRNVKVEQKPLKHFSFFLKFLTHFLAAGENIDPGPTWHRHKHITD